MQEFKAKQPREDVDFLDVARRVVRCEQDAVSGLCARLDECFSRSCALMLACEGHIVVTGIGKSGHIGRKMAATFASTGSPALFLHPAEAGHGDMGMVTSSDVVLAVSYSGEAPELLALVPLWKRMHLPLIAMTGNPKSKLAHAADVCLDVHVEKEACPLDLAPTSSTTVSLVMGDAMAIALLEARGFNADDFAFSHPSGVLGHRLLLTAGDVMRTGDDMPKVSIEVTVADALIEMNRCGLGMATVVDAQNKLCGVLTDGDLRRALNERIDVYATPIRKCMTPGGHTVDASRLAVEVLNMMEEHRITSVVCVDNEGCPQGVVHMHHLLHAGLV